MKISEVKDVSGIGAYVRRPLNRDAITALTRPDMMRFEGDNVVYSFHLDSSPLLLNAALSFFDRNLAEGKRIDVKEVGDYALITCPHKNAGDMEQINWLCRILQDSRKIYDGMSSRLSQFVPSALLAAQVGEALDNVSKDYRIIVESPEVVRGYLNCLSGYGMDFTAIQKPLAKGVGLEMRTADVNSATAMRSLMECAKEISCHNAKIGR